MDVSTLALIAAGVIGIVLVVRAVRKNKAAPEAAEEVVAQPPRDPMKKPDQAAVIKRKPVRSKNGRTYRYDHTGRDGRDYYRDDRGGDLVDFLILWWILDELSQDAYMADYPEYVADESYQAEAEALSAVEFAESVELPDQEPSSDGFVDEGPNPLPGDEEPLDDGDPEPTPAPEPTPEPVQEEVRPAPAPAPSYEPPADTGGGYDSGDSGGGSDDY